MAELARSSEIDAATLRLLKFGAVPLWAGAGFADWLCHRRTSIETTAGTKESAIHALMMTEAGVPTLLGLFFEVDAGVLAVTLSAFALHQATAIWDVAYADGRRRITPTEQHVHGLLEQVPAMATAFLCALHWDQATALLRGRHRRAAFRLTRKRGVLSTRYRAGLLAAVGGLVIAPYAEELQRCRRAKTAPRTDTRTGDDHG
jgi:hypothetical protein